MAGSPLFMDADVLKIFQLADERKTLEISKYLNHPNKLVRKHVALSFASIRDTTQYKSLETLLKDSIDEVQIAAAYALGQLGTIAASEVLTSVRLNEYSSEFKSAVLEAIGKTIGENGAKYFYETDASNEIETIGWAKGVAWYFYRGFHREELMSRMPHLLYPASPESKYFLAYAMTRFKGDWFKENEKYLSDWLTNERHPGISSLIVTMLGKIDSESAIARILSTAISPSMDERIKINAVRSLSKTMKSWNEQLPSLCDDKSNHVVMEALQFFSLLKPTIAQLEELDTKLQNRNVEIRSAFSRLYAHLDESQYKQKIEEQLKLCKNEVDSNFVIRAMGSSGKVFLATLQQLLIAPGKPSLKTATADALVEAHTQSEWPGATSFEEIARAMIATGDPGVIAIAATHLRDEKFGLKGKIKDTGFLKTSLEQLEMPREVETVNELIRTINYLDNSKIEEKIPAPGHPIDWEKVKKIAIDQKVKIVTSKGEIVVQLAVEESPGSAANFISLIESGFYNHKVFHRVVPNFVIQAGCPRGDGWGSTDYCIRSEFSLHDYRAGALGMASAGPDTESCQWFITHVPTPHLEGRYTIFGYVTEGMDVVSEITIGDRIESMELIYP